MIGMVLNFILSPLGKWASGVLVALAFIGGVYVKGRSDGKAAYAAKVKAEISDAIKRGQQGRADALQELQNKEVPNGWFRD